jgi:glutamate/tyrosine decarboxylase-like PLP-dependent enzyme
MCIGHVNKKFDFQVDGVTAMSADIHKFGYGPKQAYVIRHKKKKKRCAFV